MIRRFQAVVVMPIDFELTVGIFVIILVGPPAQLAQGGTDFRDYVVTAHQRRLVVTRLLLNITVIGNRRAVFVDQMKLRFHTGFHQQSLFGGLRNHRLQNIAGCLRNPSVVYI